MKMITKGILSSVALIGLLAAPVQADVIGKWSGVYQADFSVNLAITTTAGTDKAGMLAYGEPWGCDLELYFKMAEGSTKHFSIKHPLVGSNGPRCRMLEGGQLKATESDSGVDIVVLSQYKGKTIEHKVALKKS